MYFYELFQITLSFIGNKSLNLKTKVSSRRYNKLFVLYFVLFDTGEHQSVIH